MPEKPSHDALPLRTVSRLSGLSPDVIRAWEKRYRVVAPRRGPRGARLYSSDDVTHLSLLRRVVGAGRAIGDVARLSRAELEALAESASNGHAGTKSADASRVDRAVAALERFDATELDRYLGDALLALGTREFIAQVVVPLLDEVGERWSDGRLSVAEEHLLSGLLRNLLSGLMRARGHVDGATILLATPQGERHEFGLLLTALLVADARLRLCYLGTDLPAAEIASAARRAGATVVGLGVVNGDNREQALAELRRIEHALPHGVEVWLGGREASALAGGLGRSRAVVLNEIAAIERELARIHALAETRV